MIYFDIYTGLLNKPRQGWLNRGIPKIECENVLEHSFNVRRACVNIIKGNFLKIDNPKEFIIMGEHHDDLEYDMPDFTPSDNITKERKLEIEYNILDTIKNILGKEDTNIADSIEEYMKQKTNDSKILRLLDHIDAGVKALEYERQGYKTDDFYPYVLEKIKDNEQLTNIYNILLKKEFNHINYHFQYFLLLQLAGNHNLYREKMLNLN